MLSIIVIGAIAALPIGCLLYGPQKVAGLFFAPGKQGRYSSAGSFAFDWTDSDDSDACSDDGGCDGGD